MHPNEPIVRLIGGPMPLAINCVSLRVRVDGGEVSTMMLPDRTVCIPEWVESSIRVAARGFTSLFEKQHRVIIHELLKQSRNSIKETALSAVTPVVIEPPKVNRSRELVFRLALGEDELVLHVASLLVPCQFQVNQDNNCNIAQLFAAYDVALEYMQEHADEIEGAGFDTNALRASMSDWQGYRERLRVV